MKRAHGARMAAVGMFMVLCFTVAVVGGSSAANPAPGPTFFCTAAEQAAYAKQLAAFKKSMPARRRSFFRHHKSKSARRRFLRSQRDKLQALELLASCTVVADGAKIAQTFAVAKDGPVAFGLGSVWVVDREDGNLTNGIPDGKLYRLDPQTGQVQEVIPHVLGSDAVVADGSVWVASFGLNRLLRIDPATHAVTWIKTGPSDDERAQSIVATSGAIWVANHHSGTLVRIDPATNVIAATIHLTAPGDGGLQPLATDGTSVWVASASANTLWRIDAATNAITATTTIPPEYSGGFGICGGIAADPNGVWVSPGCNTDAVSRVDPHTNTLVATVRTDTNADSLELGAGSVWVVNDTPNWLFRIDPQSNKVIGRLALPAPPAPSNIQFADGALWLRTYGAVLKIVPS